MSGLPGTSRQNASASAPGPADRWPHAPPAAAGAAERKSLMRRSARRGGGAPAAASGLSLATGSASMVRQPWGMGRERRRRRARQVSCTEALGAWMAGRERDGPRVRDAATHVESGREEVESRDPTGESNPVAWPRPKASDHTWGRNMSAIYSPPATAGVKERKSLDRCSARCGGRLPATADGSGLPRGSASVMHQLARAGTRVCIGRGRQIARREALAAQVATGEQRQWAKGRRAQHAPLGR